MTTLLDDFQRTDSSSLGPTWASYTNGFKIVSGAAVALTTATNFAQMVAVLATGDHRAEITVGNTYGGSFTGVAVRMGTIGADGAATGACYLMILSGSTGTAFSIRRKEASSATLTTLATGNSTVDGRLDNSVWALEVYANPLDSTQTILKAYVNGALVVSATDTATNVPATQRKVGIYTGGTTGPSMRFGQITATDIDVPVPDTTAPTVPGSVTATATSGTAVTVAWAASTDAVGVTSYRVRRDGADLATAVTGTSYNDTAALTGTHSYTVSAVDAAGNRSAESAAASVTITPPDTTPPPVPTGLTATAGVQQVSLGWSASVASDLAGYRLYRWTAAAPTPVRILTTTSRTYVDTGVVAGTAYSYGVSAYDVASNESSRSTTASATPTAPSVGSNIKLWDGTTAVSQSVYTTAGVQQTFTPVS